MPSIISNSSSKKIPEVKQVSVLESTNISFPFGKPYGPKTFGSLMTKLMGYQQKKDFDIRPPGEGLPRVIHYCADQSGCAFWRMIWPGDELLAHNKTVVMTLYQMVTDANFYRGIDAVRLQRQCTEVQRDFVRFLREVSNQLKEKTGKGFRIIYELDDVLFSDMISPYNVCGDSFQDPKIEVIVKEIVHLCVDEDTSVFCSVNGIIMDISVKELKEYFDEGRNIKVMSKNLEKNVGEFKTLENCWITSEEADVIEITDTENDVSLVCTEDHPIYTKNRGWVEAGKLLENDILDFG
jgi:hypothetical protein